MALAVVQHPTANDISNANTTAVTVTGLTAGNLVVVVTGSGVLFSVNGVADGGNTYTQVAGARATHTDGHWMDMWYAKNISGGSTTITVTYSLTSINRRRVQVYEISGADTTAPLDQSGATLNASGAGSIDTGPSLATTAANEILIAACATSQAVSTQNDATFTLDVVISSYGFSHAIVSATGTYTPKWNDGVNAPNIAATAASFKQAGGAAVTVHSSFKTLLGVGNI